MTSLAYVYLSDSPATKRECSECRAECLEQQRGCLPGSLADRPVTLSVTSRDGKHSVPVHRVDRCPLAIFRDAPPLARRLFEDWIDFRVTKHLPEGGGVLDQTNRFCEALDIIEAAVATVEKARECQSKS